MSKKIFNINGQLYEVFGTNKIKNVNSICKGCCFRKDHATCTLYTEMKAGGQLHSDEINSGDSCMRLLGSDSIGLKFRKITGGI